MANTRGHPDVQCVGCGGTRGYILYNEDEYYRRDPLCIQCVAFYESVAILCNTTYKRTTVNSLRLDSSNFFWHQFTRVMHPSQKIMKKAHNAMRKELKQKGTASMKLWDDGKHAPAFQGLLWLAQRGAIPAIDQVGHAYEVGDGVTHDPKRALAWYHHGAKLGQASSYLRLAHCYRRGHCVGIKNGAFAARLYTDVIMMEKVRNTNQHTAIAYYWLGHLYEYGLGVHEDWIFAWHLYMESVLHGYRLADFRAAHLFFRHQHMMSSKQRFSMQMAEFFRIAAPIARWCMGISMVNDSTDSICCYAWSLGMGVGGNEPTDMDRARLLCQKAADRGHRGAARLLADDFKSNTGPPAPEGIGDANDIGLLGAGHFSRVYLIEQEGTGRRFARKQMKQKDANIDDERSVLRRRECRYLVRYHEVSFVSVNPRDRHDKRLCLYMEYMAGGPLSQYSPCEKDGVIGTLPCRALPEQIMLWSYMIAEGLLVLFAAGYTHRDLKPSNLLFVDNKHYHIKISDFGLAAKINGIVKDNDESIKYYASGPYLPPEHDRTYTRCDTRPLWTPSADIWQFAKILIELITHTRQPIDPTTQRERHYDVAGSLSETLFEYDDDPDCNGTHNGGVTASDGCVYGYPFDYLQMIIRMINTIDKNRPSIQEIIACLQDAYLFIMLPFVSSKLPRIITSYLS